MTSYSFKCRDIGMDCGFETKANEKDSLMKNITSHAKEVHKMDSISPDLAKKVESAIKTH